MSTPTAGGTGKVCVLCGEDVAAKPRTKDGHGRYYCQPCYDQAIAQKHAKRATAPMPKVQTRPPIVGSLKHEASDDGSAHILEGLIDLQPAPAQLSMICPACRQNIPAGGVICTHCGFNVQTQESLAGKVKVKTQRAAGGTLWPPIVGIISMVLGGFGVLVYGAYFLIALLAVMAKGGLGAALVSILPVGSLLTALAAWLLRDGWRILRRNSDGVKWIRYWAMTKILLYGSCLTLFMALPPGKMAEALSRTDSTVTVSDVKSSILLVLCWFLAWPVFVMIFFFIPRIQEDVEAWD